LGNRVIQRQRDSEAFDRALRALKPLIGMMALPLNYGQSIGR
jgi:hypothetical protein